MDFNELSNYEHNLSLIEKLISSTRNHWEEQEIHLIEEDFNWENYSEGYYKTLNIILSSYFLEDFISDKYKKDIIELGTYKNQLVFPIIFLFRHYLEITIKHILFRFNKYLDNDIKFLNHNLMKLYSDLKNINDEINLKLYGEKKDNEFSKMDSIIENFNIFDNNSFSFRYPSNKENIPCFQKDFTINTLNLAESLKIVHKIFQNLLFKMGILEFVEEDTNKAINRISTYEVVDYDAEDYTKYFGDDAQ